MRTDEETGTALAMRRGMHTLERYMTRHSWSIGPDAPLARARDVMTARGVRHLPVLDAGALVGILSDRDVKAAEAGAASRASLRVRDALVDEAVAVDIDTSLYVVARAMAEKKLGSVIVLEDGRVAGIFTSVDACRALADALAPEAFASSAVSAAAADAPGSEARR